MLSTRKFLQNMVFILLLFTLLFPLYAFGASPRNVIMVNPMALVGSNICPEYEIALDNNFGLGVRADIVVNWEWKGGKDSSDSSDDYDWIYSVDGYGMGLSARFYPGGKAPVGFYIGPRVDFIAFNGTYEDRAHNQDPVDTNLTLGTTHLEIGYKFIFGDTVALGLFADGGYAFAEAPSASSLLALTYIIGGGIYLGIAF